MTRKRGLFIPLVCLSCIAFLAYHYGGPLPLNRMVFVRQTAVSQQGDAVSKIQRTQSNLDGIRTTQNEPENQRSEQNDPEHERMTQNDLENIPAVKVMEEAEGSKPVQKYMTTPRSSVLITPVKPHQQHIETSADSVRLCSREERLGMMQEYCKKHHVATNYFTKLFITKRLNNIQTLEYVDKFEKGAALNTTQTNTNINAERNDGAAHISGSRDIVDGAANTSGSREFANGSRDTTTDPPRDLLDLIPDGELLGMAHELWMDKRNKVIVCMHAKAGCSTWKTILANNSGEERVWESGSIHGLIFKRGMTCADDTRDAGVIRERLRTWYKIAIVRHPYDRLVSAYREKLAGNNVHYERSLGRHLMERFQPHLPEEVRKEGKLARFQDFIQYVLDDDPKDDHFKGPYEEKCHACLLGYDYIVKLETNDIDARYIIGQKLQGMGLDSLPHANARTTARSDNDQWDRRGRDLSLYFRNLTLAQIDGLQRRHRGDLGMFGYAMDEESYQARCFRTLTDGEHCC